MRFCAAFVIGEYLIYSKLSFGSNAGDAGNLFVFEIVVTGNFVAVFVDIVRMLAVTCDNTGNVSAVFVIYVGTDVSIALLTVMIGIVETERNFFVVINVSPSEIVYKLRSGKIRQKSLDLCFVEFVYVVLCENFVFGIKRRMLVIETGIEHCNDHAFAPISLFFTGSRVEDTGSLRIYLVGNYVYLRLVVMVGNHRIYGAIAVSNVCKALTLAVLNGNCETVKNVYIVTCKFGVGLTRNLIEQCVLLVFKVLRSFLALVRG